MMVMLTMVLLTMDLMRMEMLELKSKSTSASKVACSCLFKTLATGLMKVLQKGTLSGFPWVM